MNLDPLLALAAFGIGIVVGLTGMGGGALMTPVLVIFFNVPPLTAVSSDLVASAVMKPVARRAPAPRHGPPGAGQVALHRLDPGGVQRRAHRQGVGQGASRYSTSSGRPRRRAAPGGGGAHVRAYIRLAEHARQRDGRARRCPRARPRSPSGRCPPSCSARSAGSSSG